MPWFWNLDEREERLNTALVKAWENRQEIPFDTQGDIEHEEQNLKWRLISVWYFGSPVYQEANLTMDVMDPLDTDILAVLKDSLTETHYKSFDIGFIYKHLSNLLNSTVETQELRDRYDIYSLNWFPKPNGGGKAKKNYIHCLRCRFHYRFFKPLIDISGESLRFSCSGCGDKTNLYWFGEMPTQWLDRYRTWLLANHARIREAAQAWHFSSLSRNRVPLRLPLAGIFKLKNRHVELICRDGTPWQVDEMGDIDDEE
ncbi:MAG: hypothetical protein Q9191_006777 [Dirinaria sp. TL-2023a]